ncbi:Holliday junction branch migration protein RuvA [Acetivibrio clariflavus]|uniref:Holliday junction branch migration complex subunit RuvA n=1 Tax=Acetivibrio clariflavus (strain DSM 19732 / NBRC 101661 / EBR45) TaxID=720554 RepID=G8LYY4_ACECE|nr:Holliday junction branch migration protein RuvA [Acetivibrio clariflavus]AEV67886.1 Holliday junction DNA helicase subunit RuvA [Acetivibrio clariflavus DSM 19732]
MFAYIRGKLEYKHNDYIVVEANGVGYKIYTSLSTIQNIQPVGNEVKIYTYLYVREDVMNLYGFLTQEELGMFELLLGVSGVGPKAAISVISSMSPSKFGLSVITNDYKSLTKAQGIGSKMAQRIVLELKDKINKTELVSSFGEKDQAADEIKDNSRFSEAVSALIVLGYTASEANKAVASVYREDMDIESVIKNALKTLVRN